MTDLKRIFLPLTEEHLELYVPARSGIFVLAIRLASGEHRIFHTSESPNLYRSLRRIVQRDALAAAPEILEHLDTYLCYFTYFAIDEIEFRTHIAKVFSSSADPVRRLTVINCN